MSTDLADLVARVVSLEAEIEKHWKARVADLERQLERARAWRSEERRKARAYKRAVRVVMAMRLRAGRDHFSPHVNDALDRIESYWIAQQRAAKAREAEAIPVVFMKAEDIEQIRTSQEEAAAAVRARIESDLDSLPLEDE